MARVVRWKLRAVIIVFLICVAAGTQPAHAPRGARASEAQRSQPKQQWEPLTRNSGFLRQSSRDALAIGGAVGALITFVALCVAIWHIRRTASAAKASTEAAITAYEESRRSYTRHVITLMSQLLSEAQLLVSNGKWELAELRLRDIADHVLQLPDTDSTWQLLAERLRGMQGSFERVRNNEIEFTVSLRGKWRKLGAELGAKLSEHTGLFPATKGGVEI